MDFVKCSIAWLYDGIGIMIIAHDINNIGFLLGERARVRVFHKSLPRVGVRGGLGRGNTNAHTARNSHTDSRKPYVFHTLYDDTNIRVHGFTFVMGKIWLSWRKVMGEE